MIAIQCAIVEVAIVLSPTRIGALSPPALEQLARTHAAIANTPATASRRACLT
jgi:hypothetical protein